MLYSALTKILCQTASYIQLGGLNNKIYIESLSNSKEMHEASSMAIALQEHSPKKFWKNIRKSRKRPWLPYTVASAIGNETETEMWKKIFCGITELIKKLQLARL